MSAHTFPTSEPSGTTRAQASAHAMDKLRKYNETLTLNSLPPLPSRLCTSCRLEWPATLQFFYRGAGKYGLQSICIACKKQDNKGRWAQAKAQPALSLEELEAQGADFGGMRSTSTRNANASSFNPADPSLDYSDEPTFLQAVSFFMDLGSSYDDAVVTVNGIRNARRSSSSTRPTTHPNG